MLPLLPFAKKLGHAAADHVADALPSIVSIGEYEQRCRFVLFDAMREAGQHYYLNNSKTKRL